MCLRCALCLTDLKHMGATIPDYNSDMVALHLRRCSGVYNFTNNMFIVEQ